MNSQLTPLGSEISHYTDQLRELQNSKGQVVEQIDKAKALLHMIKSKITDLGIQLDCIQYSNAINQDIDNWLMRGLQESPDFINSRTHFNIPENQAWTFFFGPYLLANEASNKEKGYRSEFFIVMRDDPSVCTDLHENYPHPRNICQCVRLLVGSAGIAKGNALVFFPENILCKEKMARQHFALFFFNKFEGIYRTYTLPKVRTLFGEKDALFDSPTWLAGELNTKQFYEARCVWGYLHDLYHHEGPRPFDEHVYIKMKWHLGLMEEIKVDCQTMLTLYKDESLPYRKEAIELILFERLIRYPQELDAEANFDSGTGIFLLEWLMSKSAISFDIQTAQSHIDWQKVLVAIEELVEIILSLEALDDENYIKQGRAFISRYLTLETGPKKYTFQEHHHALFPRTALYQQLNFNEIEMY